MLRLVICCVFFLFSVTAFSQETTTETIETSETTSVVEVIENHSLPEIGELKIQYLTKELEPEELYRLASFYLSEQLFLQSAELYGQYLEQPDLPTQRIAAAHYNRALSLFSMQLYTSALPEFLYAYHYNDSLNDALRMVGTIYFLNKDKEKSLEYWLQYLDKASDSPEKTAIQKAVDLLSDPAFRFDPEEEEVEDKTLEPRETWPFLNPDSIPNPDAKYQKKRIV